MITLSSTTLKGGSSKTTTCYNLGGTLAKSGKRVLLIDADPQSNLTSGFWGSKPVDPGRSIVEVWSGSPLPEQVIHDTGIANISLLPGHEDAAYANMIPPSDWGARVEVIKDLLAEVRGDYDFAIIDCAPNLHLCSHAAMVAADEVIIPLQAEDPGSRGMVPVMRAVRQIRERWGRPNVLGQLLVMFDKRFAIHQDYEYSLRELYGELVFRITIPYATAFKEAFAARQPISHHKPRSVAAKAFLGLANEIAERLEARHAADAAA